MARRRSAPRQVVRDLAGLYGGKVELEDSPLGGLRAVLELPGF